MSFSLDRLNMIIVITRGGGVAFSVKSTRHFASPILIPKLSNAGQQIFRDP
jgi:hypothetical protein